MTAVSCKCEDEGIKKRGVRAKGLEGKIGPNPLVAVIEISIIAEESGRLLHNR